MHGQKNIMFCKWHSRAISNS